MEKTIDVSTIDALIWDMDGVLVDVTRSYMEAVRKTASIFLEREVSIDEVLAIKSLIGMNDEIDATYALVSGLIDHTKIQRYGRLYTHLTHVFEAHYLGQKLYSEWFGKEPEIKLKKGLIENETLLISRENLAKLKKKYKKMAIATGRDRFEADIAIKTHKIGEYFDAIIVVENTEHHKPHPEPILKAIESIKANKSIYIGDSPSDTEAAKGAGIPCIYIGKQNLGDMQFSSTKEAVEFLLTQ